MRLSLRNKKAREIALAGSVGDGSAYAGAIASCSPKM